VQFGDKAGGGALLVELAQNGDAGPAKHASECYSSPYFAATASAASLVVLAPALSTIGAAVAAQIGFAIGALAVFAVVSFIAMKATRP
jgi:TctA family transporter